MTVYRICPFGSAKWKVQRRSTLGFWRTVTRYNIDYMFSTARTFETEADAESWIDACIRDDLERERERQETERRKREVKPRRYP